MECRSDWTKTVSQVIEWGRREFVLMRRPPADARRRGRFQAVSVRLRRDRTAVALSLGRQPVDGQGAGAGNVDVTIRHHRHGKFRSVAAGVRRQRGA